MTHSTADLWCVLIFRYIGCIQCHVNPMTLDAPNQNNRLAPPFVGRTKILYRVSHPIMQRGFLEKFYRVPPASGLLLQLATAQAGQGNSLKLFQKTSLHDGMGISVKASLYFFSPCLTGYKSVCHRPSGSIHLLLAHCLPAPKCLLSKTADPLFQ